MSNQFADSHLVGGKPQETNNRDKAGIVRARLERAKAHGEANLARLTAELERARANGAPRSNLDELQRRVTDYEKLHDWVIEKDTVELAALESAITEEENEKKRAAARALGDQKAAHREAWLNRGGSLADFEKSWPAKEAEILMRKKRVARKNVAWCFDVLENEIEKKDAEIAQLQQQLQASNANLQLFIRKKP